MEFAWQLAALASLGEGGNARGCMQTLPPHRLRLGSTLPSLRCPLPRGERKKER